MRVIKLKMNKFSLVRNFGGSSWLAVRLHRLKLAIAGVPPVCDGQPAFLQVPLPRSEPTPYDTTQKRGLLGCTVRLSLRRLIQ